MPAREQTIRGLTGTRTKGRAVRKKEVATTPSVTRNFSWSFCGNFVYAVCQFGMLMALAKIGAPEMVGQFAIGLAVTTPVMAFANLKARGIQASDARREYRFSEYLLLTLIMSGIGLLVIASTALAGGFHRETALVILLIGVGKALDVISDTYYGRYQQYEQMDRIAKPLMFNGVLSLAALALGVYVTGSLIVGAAGWAAAKALTLALFNLRGQAVSPEECGPARLDGEYQRPRANGSRKRGRPLARAMSLAWLILPLCFTAMLLELKANTPRYFIERWLGEQELGLFAAMAFLMLPGTSVGVAALSQAAGPRLARYYAQGDVRSYLALLLRLVGIGLLGGLVAVLVVLFAGRAVMTVLYSREYAEHGSVLLLVAIEAGLGFVSSLMLCGMTSARFFRPQAPLTAATVAVTVVGCLWLVGYAGQGLPGAALASVLAALFQLFGSVVIIILAVRDVRPPATPA